MVNAELNDDHLTPTAKLFSKEMLVGMAEMNQAAKKCTLQKGKDDWHFHTNRCRANRRKHYIHKFSVLRLRRFQRKWERVGMEPSKEKFVAPSGESGKLQSLREGQKLQH